MKNATTGLLTFTEADNYGALLQAYALQKTLDKLGGDSIFLNLKPAGKAAEKDLSGLPPVLRKKIEETIRHHKIRSGRFAEFREKYLKLTEFIPPQQYEELNSRFDRFIVGSDQVWNFGVTGGDMLYTLPFAEPSKRFSYAASFGGSEGLRKATDAFWEELSKFRAISLRESDSVDLCLEKTGILPSVNTDPCLLTDKSSWEKLLPEKMENASEENGYVLLFLIEYDAAFYAKAKALAESKGLSLKIITASYMPQFGFEAFSGTGVREWLQAVSEAEYVFCDSFHACVFSIIFEKKFAVNLSGKELAQRSSRLSLLLKTLGLDTENLNNDADYAAVKEKINGERENALTYLKSIYELK